jgi:hypothetical protein
MRHDGTPTSTQSEHDLVSTPISVGSEQVDNDEGDVEHTEVAGEGRLDSSKQASTPVRRSRLRQSVMPFRWSEMAATSYRLLVPARAPPCYGIAQLRKSHRLQVEGYHGC